MFLSNMPIYKTGDAVSLISLDKPVTSSDVHQNDDYGTTYDASNAVKSGNEDDIGDQCNWASGKGQVAISAGTNLFWQVDLEDQFTIRKIKVRGFDQGDTHRYFNNVEVFVCEDADGAQCMKCSDSTLTIWTMNTWVTASCGENVQGRYVRLVNSDTGGANWHFCRVEVYGFQGR